MERIIDIALGALLAVLALVAAFGAWAVVRAAFLGYPGYAIYGLRIIGQSLGCLVVVAALASIRKRLGAIEVALGR